MFSRGRGVPLQAGRKSLSNLLGHRLVSPFFYGTAPEPSESELPGLTTLLAQAHPLSASFLSQGLPSSLPPFKLRLPLPSLSLSNSPLVALTSYFKHPTHLTLFPPTLLSHEPCSSPSPSPPSSSSLPSPQPLTLLPFEEHETDAMPLSRRESTSNLGFARPSLESGAIREG